MVTHAVCQVDLKLQTHKTRHIVYDSRKFTVNRWIFFRQVVSCLPMLEIQRSLSPFTHSGRITPDPVPGEPRGLDTVDGVGGWLLRHLQYVVSRGPI